MESNSFEEEIKIPRLGKFNHGFFWTIKKKQALRIKEIFQYSHTQVVKEAPLCVLESGYCTIELVSTQTGILHWTYGAKKVFEEGDVLGFIRYSK